MEGLDSAYYVRGVWLQDLVPLLWVPSDPLRSCPCWSSEADIINCRNDLGWVIQGEGICSPHEMIDLFVKLATSADDTEINL